MDTTPTARPDEGGEETGAQPLAFEYAVRCDVRDVRARHTYWPVLLRRHNTEYVTERCSLANPIEVVVGGTGYLTQQIHCLYGKVRDCTTSNARHLNDFTGSAYCMVENCHGDGDFHGAYVTHGQFEHDLTYVGNSGLLSFANSGPTWGSSAKRITVVRHTGFWGIGFAKVSDLTLQDVAVCRTGAYDGVNTEGYGPCGVAVIVEALTDNRQRTAPEIRHYFDKFGKGMGAQGCVSWSFDRKGVIVMDSEDLDEDTVMMDALEAGADDMQADDEVFEIYTDPDAFNDVVAGLEAKGYTFLEAAVQMVPQNYVKLTDEEDIKNMEKLLEFLEDNDDVQNVYHNWEQE